MRSNGQLIRRAAGPEGPFSFAAAGPFTLMLLRCSPGVLAIVIRDTAPCVQNLGRIVQVRGPVQTNAPLHLPSWLIKPITRAPYAVEYPDRVVIAPVYWKTEAEHPDAWLLPLRLDLPETTEWGAIFDECIPPVAWDDALARLLRRHAVLQQNFTNPLAPALSVGSSSFLWLHKQ